MEYISFESAMRLNKKLNELVHKGQNFVHKKLLKEILADAESKEDALDTATTYYYRINREHPFYGANKRSGFLLADLFLQNIGMVLDWPAEDAYQVAKGVREGRISYEELKHILKAHMIGKKSIEKIKV